MSKKSFHPSRPWMFRFGEHMEELRQAYNAGRPAALYDALYLLHDNETGGENDFPLPAWVWEAMFEVLEQRLGGGPPVGPGQTGNEKARYRKDMQYYWRWSAVVDARKKGFTWEESYKEAAKSIKGGFAYAAPTTIKGSYQKVKKALTDPSQSGRFYLASHRATKMAGIDTWDGDE